MGSVYTFGVLVIMKTLLKPEPNWPVWIGLSFFDEWPISVRLTRLSGVNPCSLYERISLFALKRKAERVARLKSTLIPAIALPSTPVPFHFAQSSPLERTILAYYYTLLKVPGDRSAYVLTAACSEPECVSKHQPPHWRKHSPTLLLRPLGGLHAPSTAPCPLAAALSMTMRVNVAAPSSLKLHTGHTATTPGRGGRRLQWTQAGTSMHGAERGVDRRTAGCKLDFSPMPLESLLNIQCSAHEPAPAIP